MKNFQIQTFKIIFAIKHRVVLMFVLFFLYATILCNQILADEIIIDGDTISPVRVQNFTKATLVYDHGGKFQSVPLTLVQRIFINSASKMADFNQAEQFLFEGDVEKSFIRYERALRNNDGFIGDIAAARLTLAYDNIGRIDRALMYLNMLIRRESVENSSAAHYIPIHFDDANNTTKNRAIEQLNNSIKNTNDTDKKNILRLIRFTLKNQMAVKTSESEMETLSNWLPPEHFRTNRLYELKHELLQKMLENDSQSKQVWASLDRAILHAPTNTVDSLLFLKGKTKLKSANSNDEMIEAVQPLLRIFIHLPDSELVADSLYESASAFSKFDHHSQALTLLKECEQLNNLSSSMHKKVHDLHKQIREKSE